MNFKVFLSKSNKQKKTDIIIPSTHFALDTCGLDSKNIISATNKLFRNRSITSSDRKKYT